MGTLEVRDAVHGLIRFGEPVWAVVDTPAFQRLRGVQQLAFTHLVYPGARHSRFEHCMGAAHVAGQLAAGAGEDPGRVQLAALVHDIGHGPFSHVSEEVFERLAGGQSIHEKISAAIVKHDPAVSAALGEDNAEWIADLLTHTGHANKRSFERDVVSGPADIDKLDYLLRDSHYCGVNYGRYDLDKVIEAARRLDDPYAHEGYLAFHIDGVFALEEMLVARYHMNRQVYGHKTRIGIDNMLVRSMILGVEEHLLPEFIFSPPEDPGESYVTDYLRFDDAEVVKTLCNADDQQSSAQMMRSLMERRLCKQVMRFDEATMSDAFGPTLGGYALSPEDLVLPRLLPEVESDIAEKAGVDPIWVFLHWEDRKSALTARYSPRTQPGDILLVDDDGTSYRFHDVSEIFRRGESRADTSVSLYLRNKDDRPLEGKLREDVRNATLAGLERIGRASSEI